MPDCGRNKKNCPCGYRYTADDQKGPDAVCPECGKPRPCENDAMSNGACHLHGGKSLRGIAHPNFKTGIYAEDLPHGLLAIWESLISDEELLEGMNDLRLMYTRMKSLLRQNNSFSVFADLSEAWSEFERASRLPDGAEDDKEAKKAKQEAVSAALAEINNLIRKGKGESGRWQEIYTISDRLVRLRESERKRMMDEQSALTADRAMLLITMIVNCVTKRVKDAAPEDLARTILTGVSTDLMGVLGPSRGNGLLGSGRAEAEQV